MTDLDDLRDALRADYDPRPLDLPGVLAAGGRLRRRRRLAVGAVSGVAVLAVLVGGNQLIREQGPPPASPLGMPAAAAPTSASASAPAPAWPTRPEEDPSRPPLGEVIDTGLTAEGGGKWALWAVPIESPDLPDTSFGVMLGRRMPDGELIPDIVINETERPDRAAGFHTGQAASEVHRAGPAPAFSYYVGDAAKITARAGKRTVVAEFASWSVDPSVRIFWFSPKDVPPGTRLSGLRAVDDTGRKLPGGHPGFGVG